MKTCIVIILSLFSISMCLGDEDGWGPENDGLQCRIIVNNEYCLGETIYISVEIRNVSREVRYIQNGFDYTNSTYAKLRITGPDGKSPEKSVTRSNNGIRSFFPIQAGGVKKIDFKDPVQENIWDTFKQTGQYRITYTYYSQMPTGVPRGLPDDYLKPPWTGDLTSQTAVISISDTAKKGLAIHEWGVFTMYPNAELGGIGKKEEWDSLPKFFYGIAQNKQLPWMGAVRKPVIYIRTKDKLDLDLTIRFLKGNPVVWYPAAVNIAGGTWKKPKWDSLNWKVSVNMIPDEAEGFFHRMNSLAKPAGKGPSDGRPSTLADSSSCPWIDSLRQAGTADLYCPAGWSRMGTHYNHEKFIYYDGLIPNIHYVSVSKDQSGDSILKIDSTAPFRIPALFAVRKEGKDSYSFGFAEDIAKGTADIEIKKYTAINLIDKGHRLLRKKLTGAGLSEKETEGLVEIWSNDFFSSPGLTLFYLLPQSEYDKILPLSATPEPEGTIRVGLVHHPHAELGGYKRIDELIQLLYTEPDPENARKELKTYGPLAFPALKKQVESSDNSLVVEYCKGLLKELNSEEYKRR